MGAVKLTITSSKESKAIINKNMKIYTSQKEVEKDIKDGVLAIEGDVRFECSISIEASITAGNINARNITAWDITAWDINAWDINARNINAGDITARDISYWAFLCAYVGIKCKSFKARRENHQDPICLDGKLEIIKGVPEKSLVGSEATVEIGGKKYTVEIKKEN